MSGSVQSGSGPGSGSPPVGLETRFSPTPLQHWRRAESKASGPQCSACYLKWYLLNHLQSLHSEARALEQLADSGTAHPAVSGAGGTSPPAWAPVGLSSSSAREAGSWQQGCGWKWLTG